MIDNKRSVDSNTRREQHVHRLIAAAYGVADPILESLGFELLFDICCREDRVLATGVR